MRVEQTVSYLVLGTVGVAVAVLGVAELVLGVELAAHVGGDGGGVGDRGHGGSNRSRGSGVADSRGSSIGEADIAISSVGVAGVVVEGRSDHLGLLSQAHGQQGGKGDLEVKMEYKKISTF